MAKRSCYSQTKTDGECPWGSQNLIHRKIAKNGERSRGRFFSFKRNRFERKIATCEHFARFQFRERNLVCSRKLGRIGMCLFKRCLQKCSRRTHGQCDWAENAKRMPYATFPLAVAFRNVRCH